MTNCLTEEILFWLPGGVSLALIKDCIDRANNGIKLHACGYECNYYMFKANLRGLKKQANKLANSKADTDSSSDAFISDSDAKQTIFKQIQTRFHTCVVIGRISDSTRNKLDDHKGNLILGSDMLYINVLKKFVDSNVYIENQEYLGTSAHIQIFCHFKDGCQGIYLEEYLGTSAHIQIFCHFKDGCQGIYLEAADKSYNIDMTSAIVKSFTNQLNNATFEEWYIHESIEFILYRNVMRNETCRMMKIIDMLESEAKHLFGLQRTLIFFDLLDDGLFQFVCAGAIPDFVPNMAESTVRRYVISFFEHAGDKMNRLMTLLLSCPDSKILQQMPEQNFISLMQSVIDSSLKSKIKGGKRLSSKGIRLIMVDPDQMVVHRIADTSLERTQVSEKIENRPIHSPYFPSDCRLFIYIPTENGSYWHQLDLQRASRIGQ